MDDILKLAKDYSKKRHLDLLPCGNNNILENLDYIYDENWENQGVPYPYEILTYLFDSYYVLPERPDLAALFCWQAINHSYYVQQLGDNNGHIGVRPSVQVRGYSPVSGSLIK